MSILIEGTIEVDGCGPCHFKRITPYIRIACSIIENIENNQLFLDWSLVVRDIDNDSTYSVIVSKN